MDDSVVIEIHPIILAQSTLIDNLPVLGDIQKKFLKDLILISDTLQPSTEGSYLVSRKRYQKHINDTGGKASDPLVSKRLKTLLDLGVAQFTQHIQPGRTKINLYKLGDLSVLAGQTPKETGPGKGGAKNRRSQELVLRQRELFKADRNSIHLDGVKSISVFFHEQIFNGILDAAMRLSNKDERKEIVVKTILAGYPLTIAATCNSNAESDVAVLTDQRAMRAIISFCRKKINSHVADGTKQYGQNFDKNTVPNLFTIDIHDLCFLMGMGFANANLDIIVNMMQRLADTKFKVDATENPWFREQFSIYPDQTISQQSDTFEFRFFTNFSIAHENHILPDLFKEQLSDLRPRFYTFSLEMRLFISLLHSSTNLFLSHEGLASERSGIIHRFYNWARAFISGRSKKGVEKKWYSMVEIHEYLTPAARYDNFRIYFLRALKKFEVDGDSPVDFDENQQDYVDEHTEDNGKKKRNQIAPFKVLVYGYYVYYDRIDGVESFRFERDPGDQIVGDNSRHNKMLRREVAINSHE